MYKEVVFKETFLVSTLNITATKTGIFLCNATNDFGNSSEESTFLVTGKFIYFILYSLLLFLQNV